MSSEGRPMRVPTDLAEEIERAVTKRFPDQEASALVGAIESAIMSPEGRISFTAGAAKFELPAPSQKAVDSWLERWGGVICGALVAGAGVALGAYVANRAAQAPSKRA